MSYFIKKSDFFRVYTEERFNKLINNNDNIWIEALGSTIEFVRGYLDTRYDTDYMFSPLLEFSESLIYKIDNRIIWSAPAYSNTATYLINSYVSNNGYIYKCITPVATPENFNILKWSLVSENNSLYVCIKETTAGIYPDNTTYFEKKDSRNPRIVEIVCDIVLYNIIPRLNNIDISPIIKERYDGNDPRQIAGAVGWLKMVVKENLSINSPLRLSGQTDQTGNMIIQGYLSETVDSKQTF